MSFTAVLNGTSDLHGHFVNANDISFNSRLYKLFVFILNTTRPVTIAYCFSPNVLLQHEN